MKPEEWNEPPVGGTLDSRGGVDYAYYNPDRARWRARLSVRLERFRYKIVRPMRLWLERRLR